MKEGGTKRSLQSNYGDDELDKEPHSFKLRQLKIDPVQSRRTNDEIHTSVDMHPVMTAFMDTPQFQRLRQIKQLGVAEYVYCNTNHSRFEHSLGVAFLARKMCERIHTRQPQLPCTAKDVLCVELAGLLHDIGHGPFSHIYEVFVTKHHPAYMEKNPNLETHYVGLPKFKPELWKHEQLAPKGWKHEQLSLDMIDQVLKHLGLAIDLDNLDKPLQQIGDGIDAKTMRVFDDDINLDESLEDVGSRTKCVFDGGLSNEEAIRTSRDFVFIKELIYGGPIGHLYENEVLHALTGRGPNKEWMYDIVSNTHSGLDVDKMDYFARDQRRAFGTSGKVHTQMIEDCFVAWGECTKPKDCIRCKSWKNKEKKHLMICYGEKCEKSAINFFKLRLNLHETIYRHKTVQASAYMLMDILSLADPYFKILTVDEFSEASPAQVSESDWLPISRALLNVQAFERLTDAVIDQIAFTTDPKLKDARELIRRFRSRDLYKCMGVYDIDLEDEWDKKVWEEEEEEFKKHLQRESVALKYDDFIVEWCEVDHGKKESNPLEKMRFIKKKDTKALRNVLPGLPMAQRFNEKRLKANLPRIFQPKSIRVFSRFENKCVPLRDAFDTLINSRADTINCHDGARSDGVVRSGERNECASNDQHGNFPAVVSPPHKRRREEYD
eukprot:scaffold4940_cov163-Amphora_coffeaeformis.AAC.10